MDIPSDLLNQARDGRVVLFLGAGASSNAVTQSGHRCPTTKELGHLLSDKFLGGYMRDDQLGQIAEYAISETDVGRVQQFIRDMFLPLRPTSAHLLLPKLMWHGLATTNYDLLIETAYQEVKDRLQEPRPLVENKDRIDDNLRDPRNVLLLKLHGCVTRITNEECPLVLTPDQYLDTELAGRVFSTHLRSGLRSTRLCSSAKVFRIRTSVRSSSN